MQPSKMTCLRLDFNSEVDLLLKDCSILKNAQMIFLDKGTRKCPSRIGRARAMEAMARDVKVVAAEDDVEDKCIVCMANNADSKFAPCCHSGVCAACALEVMDRRAQCAWRWYASSRGRRLLW